MSDLVTMELLQQVAPNNVKRMLTPEIVDIINQVTGDEQFREAYRDNVIGYCHILKEGKFKVVDYLNAVKFVSYRAMTGSIMKSYARTFPDRYQNYVAKGTEPKHIASVASLYAKGKLVNLVYEATATPFHVLNQDYRQEALLTQVNLMRNEKVSPKVRSDAANSVLTHTKGPDESRIEVDLSVKQDNSIIDELRRATVALGERERASIIDGTASVVEVAHRPMRGSDE